MPVNQPRSLALLATAAITNAGANLDNVLAAVQAQDPTNNSASNVQQVTPSAPRTNNPISTADEVRSNNPFNSEGNISDVPPTTSSSDSQNNTDDLEIRAVRALRDGLRDGGGNISTSAENLIVDRAREFLQLGTSNRAAPDVAGALSQARAENQVSADAIARSRQVGQEKLDIESRLNRQLAGSVSSINLSDISAGSGTEVSTDNLFDSFPPAEPVSKVADPRTVERFSRDQFGGQPFRISQSQGTLNEVQQALHIVNAEARRQQLETQRTLLDTTANIPIQQATVGSTNVPARNPNFEGVQHEAKNRGPGRGKSSAALEAANPTELLTVQTGGRDVSAAAPQTQATINPSVPHLAAQARQDLRDDLSGYLPFVAARCLYWSISSRRLVLFLILMVN